MSDWLYQLRRFRQVSYPKQKSRLPLEAILSREGVPNSLSRKYGELNIFLYNESSSYKFCFPCKLTRFNDGVAM